MQLLRSLPGLLVLGLISVLNFPASACLAEAAMPAVVEVVSASGRTFRGRISPATDSTALHLETTQGTIRVVRPLAWDAIDKVQINNQEASLVELVRLALASKATTTEHKEQGVIFLGPSAQTGKRMPDAAFAGHDESVQDSSTAAPAVAYLEATAHYQNWDGDAVVDGLEVTFRAMDASGHPTLAHGHLEAELYAFRQQSFHHVPHGLGARFERISTWRVPLEETHGWYESRIARLPYRANSPAEDGSVVPQGLLVVRLVVPGQGVFSTSLEDVRLRPYSAFRDAAELRGNPRHVSGESPRYRAYRTP